MVPTLGGNFIVQMVAPHGVNFTPQVAPLFETFCRIRGKRYDVSMQLAWTVSRADLRTVVREMSRQARGKDPQRREAAMELTELYTRYRRQNYPPIFGGGSGPGDVQPESELLLDPPARDLFSPPPIPAAESGFTRAKPPEPPAPPAPATGEGMATRVATGPPASESAVPDAEPDPVLLG